MARTAWVCGVAAGLLLAATAAWAESVEIVTYYPSPSATTDDLRAKRVTVGSGYKAVNLDDPLAPIPDGTLLVEGSVGIGLPTAAPVPFTTAPDPSGKSPKNGLLGNLDVNDIWLRSTQSWASEALAEGTAPPAPFTVYFNTYTSRTFDVYRALELWRFGVARAQVRMASPSSWRSYEVQVRGGTGNFHTVLAFYPPTSEPAPMSPLMENGTLYLPSPPGPGGPGGWVVKEVYEVTVTW